MKKKSERRNRLGRIGHGVCGETEVRPGLQRGGSTERRAFRRRWPGRREKWGRAMQWSNRSREGVKRPADGLIRRNVNQIFGVGFIALVARTFTCLCDSEQTERKQSEKRPCTVPYIIIRPTTIIIIVIIIIIRRAPAIFNYLGTGRAGVSSSSSRILLPIVPYDNNNNNTP